MAEVGGERGEIKRKIAELFPGKTSEGIAKHYLKSGREPESGREPADPEKISLLEAYLWGLETRPGHAGLVKTREDAETPLEELRRRKE